jgi:hypothetical protein
VTTDILARVDVLVRSFCLRRAGIVAAGSFDFIRKSPTRKRTA